MLRQVMSFFSRLDRKMVPTQVGQHQHPGRHNTPALTSRAISAERASTSTAVR